jgi:hypothetical protein
MRIMVARGRTWQGPAATLRSVGAPQANVVCARETSSQDAVVRKGAAAPSAFSGPSQGATGERVRAICGVICSKRPGSTPRRRIN